MRSVTKLSQFLSIFPPTLQNKVVLQEEVFMTKYAKEHCYYVQVVQDNFLKKYLQAKITK